MTEAQWLACDEPEAMLQMAGAEARKRRLFACAAARALGPVIEDHPELRLGVVVAERYADGLEDEGALCAARERIEVLRGRMNWAEGGLFVARAAVIRTCGSLDAGDGVYHSLRSFVQWLGSAPRGLRPRQLAGLLREVVANPFRPLILSASHCTPTVVSLASAAYDERQLPSGELDPHRLAVLADALEEAGAPDEVVAHLRGLGPHVRGCWAVDLCLGLN